MKRRTFIKTSLATAASASVATSVLASPAGDISLPEKDAPSVHLSSADDPNRPVRLGWIGCGNRGTGVITTMSANTNMQIYALADILQDRIDTVLPHLNQLNANKQLPEIKKSNIYCGINAYQELLNNKNVDAVLISTPAYAHPFIFEAAVKAHKHVYCEKPAAPDVYGTMRLLEASRGVRDLTLVLGFQIRYATPYRQLIERIQRGDIGDIVTVQANYNSSELPEVKCDAGEDEYRMRNHFHYLGLSGGILNDQAIHVMDVCNWALGTTPISAIGSGNRRKAMPFGDALTNYQIIYNYPNDINIGMQAYQMGPEFADVMARFIGTKGYAEVHYTGGVFITGPNAWKAENQNGLYDADKNKGKSFIESIQNKQYINLIEDGCKATLTALLGRESVFTGKKVFWDQLIAENKRLETGVDLTRIKSRKG